MNNLVQLKNNEVITTSLIISQGANKNKNNLTRI